MAKVFRLGIAGQAGQGIKSAGLVLAKFASRSGYFTYNYIEYPSLIKGGHNFLQINISEEEVSAPSLKLDFLVALNQESINKHKEEMQENSFVLFDSDSKIDTSKATNDINLLPVPLNKLANDSGGGSLLSNTVALGAIAAVVVGKLDIVIELIKEEFETKGDKVLESNVSAVKLGYDYVKTNFSDFCGKSINFGAIKNPTDTKKIVINGNEAVGLGAIAAGMQFAAIYPMSPISNLLHFLALHQNEFGYVYKQPEDEISAINMAIGASFAGVRSMTATSGGGFCLMAEGYGLAGITETPLVIIEGMRGGPATGLPTWNGQGDLQFVLHAHQDEFPRIVLAAGDVGDAFFMTMEAFYIADKYQAPVVLLLDKNICDHEQSVPFFDASTYRIDRGKFTKELVNGYKRYVLSDDGVSVRTIPGTGNFFIANSDEHSEIGFSLEDSDGRIAQMKKRMKKLETCATTDMPDPTLYGPKNAELTIVSWGSNKGSILQALKKFPNVNYLHIGWMNPFPDKAVSKILASAKDTALFECNYAGQLANLIREKTGIEFNRKILKYDGRPFFVEEIEARISEILEVSGRASAAVEVAK